MLPGRQHRRPEEDTGVERAPAATEEALRGSLKHFRQHHSVPGKWIAVTHAMRQDCWPVHTHPVSAIGRARLLSRRDSPWTHHTLISLDLTVN